MEQILENLNPQVSESGSSPLRIPVYFFHLRWTNGSTAHISYDIEQSINILNAYFEGLFDFYVCGQAQIDHDQFVGMNLTSTDVADLHQIVNMNFPLAQECVKVFLCDLIELGVENPGGYAHDRIQFGTNGAVYYFDPREAIL